MQGIWVCSLVGKLRFPHALEQVSPSATTIAGIKIAGRNTNNLRYADDTTLMAESEGELKRVLMQVREESEKVGLKLNIQKTKIMASGPITSGQMEKQWKQWQTLFFGAPKSLQMVIAAMKSKDA